ncbi:MAG: metallophosphoesterase [candidate division Zixibacteria bacterium]|nr:metallophosphoesterase [candidate division Zixibacteria bacterium]MDH3937173.1 metallophosphoesterase [candidate division Zixibacteria bacterium]MDH4035161.1 metallophosphoesterase [candidate division Zixibacteria bacterium]
MREFFPLIFSLIAIGVIGLIEILLLALANRPWWSRPWVRRVSWGLPLFGILMVLVWGLGQYYAVTWLRSPAAVLAVLSFVLEVALMLSLPVSGVIHLAHWVVDRVVRRRRLNDPKRVDNNRRALLRVAAAGLPVAAVSMGLAGVTHAFSDIRVYLKPIKIDPLPPALEGLRILHISDSHLSHYITLDAIEDVLTRAESLAPDLVAISGDIADDLSMLGGALNMITELRAPLGVYACLGNHEYYRGLHKVKQIFGRTTVPLLVNQSVRLDVNGTKLRVAGIEDPRFVGGGDRAFFKNAIDSMLEDTDPADFTILLSHRPSALDYASEVNLDLILAGHTHGGQIGGLQRSLFEVVSPDSYLWGHYQKEQSHLYTSSGVGHWFPFRLGCPAEAPVIELSSK